MSDTPLWMQPVEVWIDVEGVRYRLLFTMPQAEQSIAATMLRAEARKALRLAETSEDIDKEQQYVAIEALYTPRYLALFAGLVTGLYDADGNEVEGGAAALFASDLIRPHIIPISQALFFRPERSSEEDQAGS